jgi:hypothetical protein
MMGEILNINDTSSIEMEDDGSVIVHESSAERERRTRWERINGIREKISDPNSDPADISRAIAVEIAVVAGNMVAIDGTMMSAPQLKAFSEQVRALRELGKQLSDTEVLSNKDSLNFDGPRFAFVLETIVNMFVKAMKEAGLPEDMRTSVMRHYRDEMQMSEAKIRQDTQKIGDIKRGRR